MVRTTMNKLSPRLNHVGIVKWIWKHNLLKRKLKSKNHLFMLSTYSSSTFLRPPPSVLNSVFNLYHGFYQLWLYIFIWRCEFLEGNVMGPHNSASGLKGIVHPFWSCGPSSSFSTYWLTRFKNVKNLTRERRGNCGLKVYKLKPPFPFCTFMINWV